MSKDSKTGTAESVKGYKATLWNGMPKHGCRRTPYKEGGVYSVRGDLVPCRSGLHFCGRLCHVYGTYDPAFYTRVFEVEALGRTCFDANKTCTGRLRFARELAPEEALLRLADDANLLNTARYACVKTADILYSVVKGEQASFGRDAVWTGQEWRHLPEPYRAVRKLQWAQAFSKYGALPICRLAMGNCHTTRRELDKLVETLQSDPALQPTEGRKNEKEV